ncbi:MAG: cupin domain-containing protein [Candidatus Omnitrophica bacterium]|nr:cupin domain-containing protein [Candidatus Omnitrophota bacterium]
MRRGILFLSVVLLFAFTLRPAFAEGKQEASKIQAVKVTDIKEFNVDKFIKKSPFNTDKFVYNVFYFNPRQILPFHKHPASDELFYIVDGVGQFTVGNESVIVGPSSSVYGPANVFHGLVNSGDKEMIIISIQAPKPVTNIYAENSTLACPVCKQEIILKEGVKEGDIYICPRCGAKLKVTKGKDGKWIGVQM